MSAPEGISMPTLAEAARNLRGAILRASESKSESAPYQTGLLALHLAALALLAEGSERGDRLGLELLKHMARPR